MTTTTTDLTIDDPRMARLASMEGLGLLDDDLRAAADRLGDEEARFLVDTYYQVQEFRKTARNQRRSMEDPEREPGEEPHLLTTWAGDVMARLERSIKTALGRWGKGKRVGRWCHAQYGVGAVITAGLLAHFDLSKAPHAGHFFSFAGLNPDRDWLSKDEASKVVKENVRGDGVDAEDLARVSRAVRRRVATIRNLAEKEDGTITKASLRAALCKRPYNAELKSLCAYKMGECFVRFSGNDACFYGHYYAERKVELQEKNENGEYADQAQRYKEGVGKGTKARKFYERGMLPPAHIHARARRLAVKLFLSHLHHVWFECENGLGTAPKPWVLTQPDHDKFIEPPHWPID